MSTQEARTNETMKEEHPPVVTIDDADDELVNADTATDLKEKETKGKKGGTGGNGWWSGKKGGVYEYRGGSKGVAGRNIDE